MTAPAEKERELMAYVREAGTRAEVYAERRCDVAEKR
jgi:hypothetical protein